MKKYNINEELHSSVRTGKYEAVIKLINEGADVNYKDNFANDALFYAVVHCKEDIAKYLLSKGANLKILYKEQKNILHIAVETECEDKGAFGIIELLVEKGIEINAKDEYGNTPLGYACIYYTINTNTMKLLLQNGADFNIKNNHGLSDYSSAKQNNRVELIEILDKYKK